ncbi:VOC family protein [Alteromonas sp. ASW11-36]|uniref:VOC family protein n=1 Tax=Alteromonas arenosi TaxID=3055817 RepID=A0ABT7SS88_9ALTE|nr:VOC family protein [Alteromonas sp. ASW11-36]MDM7859010.1 VOC family protein [Alteromonas sp. ASW11-36]
MLAGIHHVAIIASDYQRSKRFYTHVLGCQIVDENYRPERDSYKLDLAIPGGGQIELFSFPDAPERPSRPEAQGLRHLSFKVENLETAISQLKSHHIEVEPIRIDPYTQCRFTFFQDPDGLPLELYEIGKSDTSA